MSGSPKVSPRHEGASPPEKAPSPDATGTRSGGGDDGRAGDSLPSPTKPRRLATLPGWVADNLKPQPLRMLVRCWAATWVCFLLILIRPSLLKLGQAAFFTCIVTLMLPANMAPMIWLLANATLVVGTCLGWAWGSAATAAASRVRDLVETSQRLQTAQSSVASSTNPDGAFQLIIFQGRFLDTKNTAVIGAFFVVGVYFFGVVTASRPNLKLLAIFGTIVLDVICSYQPLFPSPNYTLATIFLLPIGVSLGVSAACMLVFFPTTLSYTYTSSLVKVLRLAGGFLGCVRRSLDTGTAQGVLAAEPELAKMRPGFVGLDQMLSGQQAFLELEVTWSPLGGKDVIGLYGKMRVMAYRLLGLNVLHHIIEQSVRDGASGNADSDPDAAPPKASDAPVTVAETFALRKVMSALRSAAQDQHVELDDLLPRMASAAAPTLDASAACLRDVADWLEDCNERRWFASSSAAARKRRAALAETLASDVERLRSAARRFEDEERLALVAPYERHFATRPEDGSRYLDAAGTRHFRMGARALQECASFSTALLAFARELEGMTQCAAELASKRRASRLWFPTGLRRLGKLAMSGRSHADGLVAGQGMRDEQRDDAEGSGSVDEDATLDDERREDEKWGGGSGSGKAGDTGSGKVRDEAERKERLRLERLAQRDPDALPPSNPFHHVGRFLAACHRFFWSPTGAFALRYTVASFAIWIVAVVPSTAAFNYSNRGLWALIMAQTGLAVTAGEMVFSLIARLVGTVLGLVFGMLFWYIASGNGQGNAYGLAATMGVAFVPIVFLRLYAPPALLMPAIMLGVTSVLIVGYSWQDGTGGLVSASNPGIGYQVAWRRFLLVVIGMAVAFLVTLFPKPPSSRRVVRKQLALTTSSILALFTACVEGWMVSEASDGSDGGSESSEAKPSPSSSARTEQALVRFRRRYASTVGVLLGLQKDIAMARFDLSIRGRWPASRYEQAARVCTRCLEALGQLATVLGSAEFDATWRRTLRMRTAILDPGVVADTTSFLWLLAQSLDHGAPLPPATGLLTERTLSNLARRARTWDSLKDKRGEETLSLEMLRDPHYMRFQASQMAFIQLVRNLDELKAIVADLCGEGQLAGFAELRDDWARTAFQAFHSA